MKPAWDDVNARVRGLATRFQTPSDLERLVRAPDLSALEQALRGAGIVRGETLPTPTAAELEFAVRHWAAALLRTLARWCGPRVAALPLVFELEDRHSVRALLRGAVEHAPPELRLAGLIPTPALPERTLVELARAPSPARLVALLGAWHHPLAAPLAPAATHAEPDLFALEVALARAWAADALAASRRAGDAALIQHVRESIDLENALTAITLASEGKDVVPATAFVPGGRLLTIGDFEEAVAAREPAAAGVRLGRALATTPYGVVLLHGATAAASLEDELMRTRIRAVARRVRLAPLGPLAVIEFGLRLRAQVTDLQRIIWGVALGLPRESIPERLATVAR